MRGHDARALDTPGETARTLALAGELMAVAWSVVWPAHGSQDSRLLDLALDLIILLACTRITRESQPGSAARSQYAMSAASARARLLSQAGHSLHSSYTFNSRVAGELRERTIVSGCEDGQEVRVLEVEGVHGAREHVVRAAHVRRGGTTDGHTRSATAVHSRGVRGSARALCGQQGSSGRGAEARTCRHGAALASQRAGLYLAP